MPPFSHLSPFDLVIFGGTGDLALRKLLPALFCQFQENNIPEHSRIIGASRAEMTTAQYREETEKALLKFYPASARNKHTIQQFLKIVYYTGIDLTDASHKGWEYLSERLDEDNLKKNRIFYFSTAPSLFEAISENLSRHKLITAESRAVMEKPIGRDGASANAINEAVGKYFEEDKIFRIDHYLGKESTQNILQFRFSNPLIDAIWSGKYIKNIEITASETVGLESRASYYDTSGAARDMIQNHLLQILSLCTIDRPKSLSGDDIRNEKISIFKSLIPLREEEIKTNSIRGQYTEGTAEGRAVPSYATELGHESQTETFAAIRVQLDLPRWKGTSFCLKTGKRMNEKRTDIKITFHNDVELFPNAPANQMKLDLQETNDITVELNVRSIGFSQNTDGLRPLLLQGSYSPPAGVRTPSSYETLLMAIAHGDQSLFVHREEVDAAWKWIEPILKSWEKNVPELLYYPSGGSIPRFSEVNQD
ncbi:glucose-6-phosphate 1-dehydrogenase [Lasius niger]|uniref:Glucose-6-phosphate 1-dehydrogenase n=1 Tax=Lasius niger TaxID=67767 RepID=A0A0J7KL68_LASNI|nr:glucose-6-phosphate 1-dehydrogenase [Lasius niger]